MWVEGHVYPPNIVFQGIIMGYQHVKIMIDILMNLFIIFHPSTRYSPDTNLGMLPKSAGRSFYRFGCQRRDPVVQSFCSVSMDATQSFVLNVPLPYWLATFLSLAC
jgi:hypothetical protein